MYFGISVRSDILLMEAVRSSETSVFMYLTARRHIPYDSKYHSYNCHYLKCNPPPDGNKLESQTASCIQLTYRLKTYDTRLRVTTPKQSTSWIWWPWVTPKCRTFFSDSLWRLSRKYFTAYQYLLLDFTFYCVYIALVQPMRQLRGHVKMCSGPPTAVSSPGDKFLPPPPPQQRRIGKKSVS